VSVVIPTRSRPELLRRSLTSVAAQTHPALDVVVVVDGPDAETERLLSGWSERPLTVVVNERPLGGGEARNVGVRTAAGDWIAFLDDDDEWLPHKLERQLTDLTPYAGERVVGLSQLITRSPSADFIGPREAPRPGEPLSEYLFVRSGWFKGGGRVQTSTLVVPRRLMLEVPFDSSLPRYQETDWILRAAHSGARLIMTMEPLSIWYVEEARGGITRSFAGDWRFALEWIRERRHLMTRRAYASLVLVRVGGLAAQAREPRGAWAAWREATRVGRPRPRDVALFLGKWVLSPGMRRRLRARLAGDPKRG
jgi:glycosyltransferase involved in cell wall biosynthesis